MSRQQRLQCCHAAPHPRTITFPLHLLQGGRQPAHLDLPPALHQLVRQVAEEVAGRPADMPGSSTVVAVGTSVQGGEAAKTGRLQLLRLRPYCSEVGGQRTTGRYMCSAGAYAVGTSVHAGEAVKVRRPHLRPLCTGFRVMCTSGGCVVLEGWQVTMHLSGPAHTGSSRLGLLLRTTCSVLICSLGCEGAC